MGLVEKTAPGVEPVTTAELKAHLRVTSADEDTLVASIGKAARVACEVYQRRSYVDTVWTLWLDVFPAGREITLPRSPVSEVASVKFYDTGDTEDTVDSSDYILDDTSEPARIVLRDGASWPATTLRTAKGVAVEFTAGYGAAAADVPDRWKHAIKLLTAHLFENREPYVTGTIVSGIPWTIKWLLAQGRLGGWVS
jgi:uncharacterized phiE125 gp8 family phage protein